jgi:hypothetical protein
VRSVSIEQPKPATSRCPLCGEENACALAAGGSRPCWCAAETFPDALLERVPAGEGQGSCICRRCLEAFRESERTGKAG